MLDLHHHTQAAERLRRWARRGIWRRMVQANIARAARPAAKPSVLTRIEHQVQCLSRTMMHSNPSR